MELQGGKVERAFIMMLATGRVNEQKQKIHDLSQIDIVFVQICENSWIHRSYRQILHHGHRQRLKHLAASLLTLPARLSTNAAMLMHIGMAGANLAADLAGSGTGL